MTSSKSINLRLFILIAVLSFVAMLSISTKASATLAGEDGLILYVENEDTGPKKECEVDYRLDTEEEIGAEYECEAPINEVITTDPDGTNETVAATEENPITAATISAPNEEGNNEIVYATVEAYCMVKDDWDRFESDEVMPIAEREPCEDGWMYRPFNNNVVLNHVEVDEDGNQLSDPTTVVDIDPTYPNALGRQTVEGLSYSPDGDAVVMTRVESTFKMPNGMEPSDTRKGPKATWTVEKVTVEDGTIETLVEPVRDPFVAAGYGQNGNVYYTQSSGGEKPMPTDKMNKGDRNSDLWYIPAGGNKEDAVQVTTSTKVNEYFLSASPDNTKVLVCDPMTSLYYYINLADGSALELDTADGFMPVGFSPNGEALYGNYYSYNPLATEAERICGSRLMAATRMNVAEATVEEMERGIAVALVAELDNPSVINEDLRGVEDWAPKYVAVVEEEPGEVLGETTTPTLTQEVLQSTGSSAYMSLVAGAMTLTTAGATTAATKKRK